MLLIGCGDDSPSGPNGAEKVTISGTVAGQNASFINRVGVFQTGGDTEKVVDLDKDNASPSTVTTVTNLAWSIDLPTNVESLDLFQVVGWADADDDGKFDPESKEINGWGRIAGDSVGVAAIWYFNVATGKYVAGWNVESGFGSPENLKDHLNDWFILVDGTSPLLSITNPTNNSEVSGEVEIIVSVTDNYEVVKVEFYIDDNLPDGGTDTTEPYSYIWDVTTLEKNSSHTIFAKAFYLSGNFSVSPTVNVTIMGSRMLLVPSEYPTIQAGIDEAKDKDTVLVEPGTYVENINYNGKNIIVGSLFLTTRDTTFISQTIIDGNQSGSVVEFGSGENSQAVLSGFTITNGWATRGGGIFCLNYSNPSLEYLKITGNSAYEGGGIGCSSCNLSLVEVVISGNSTRPDPPGPIRSDGGGIWGYDASLTLLSVTIRGNRADDGGGIYLENSSNISLEDVTVSENSARWNGGGIYCQLISSLSLVDVTITKNRSTLRGGGIGMNSSTASLRNVTVSGNSDSYSVGGIFIAFSSVSLENVNVFDNKSNFNGMGGIYSFFSNLSLVNVTVSGNAAVDSGGGIYSQGSNLNLMNTILWNNSPSEIYIWSRNDPDSISIAYSDVEGGETGIVIESVNAIIEWMEGNIDSDPMFVDPDNGDFHLQGGSPSIDTGNPDQQYNDTDGSRNNMGAYGGPFGNW